MEKHYPSSTNWKKTGSSDAMRLAELSPPQDMSSLFRLSTWTFSSCSRFRHPDLFPCLLSMNILHSSVTQPMGKFVKIEGWPVQFLPVYNRLTEEVTEEAAEVKFGETSTRVFSAEYLAAIMIETGRPKDHARLLLFFESESVDRSVLEDIAARHGLKEKWEKFQRYYLREDDRYAENHKTVLS